MSILSGFIKTIKYRLTDTGYIWQTEKTSSQTVVMGDGSDDADTLENRLGSLKGVTSSLSSTDPSYALSAEAGKNLQDQVSDLNTNLEDLSTNVGNMATTFKFTCNGVTTSNGVYIKDANGNSLKSGRYKVDLLSATALATECASSYIINIANGNMYKTILHEGTNNASPRIEYNSTYGLYVLLANYSTALNVVGVVTKL